MAAQAVNAGQVAVKVAVRELLGMQPRPQTTVGRKPDSIYRARESAQRPVHILVFHVYQCDS